MASSPRFEPLLLCLLLIAFHPSPAAADDPVAAERTAAAAIEAFGGRLETDRDGRLYELTIPRSKGRGAPFKVQERLWAGGPAGLNGLKDLPHLKTVLIQAEGFNRDHARMLAQLPELTTLVIRADDVTDEAVVELLQSATLTRLSLTSPLLTDNCLQAPKLPPALRDLTIQSRKFKGATLGRLAECRELRRLCLAFSGVEDTGTQLLPQITSLRIVDLNGTLVTDASIDHLLAIPRLGAAGLYRTKMTKEGIDVLERRAGGKISVDR